MLFADFYYYYEIYLQFGSKNYLKLILHQFCVSSGLFQCASVGVFTLVLWFGRWNVCIYHLVNNSTSFLKNTHDLRNHSQHCTHTHTLINTNAFLRKPLIIVSFSIKTWLLMLSQRSFTANATPYGLFLLCLCEKTTNLLGKYVLAMTGPRTADKLSHACINRQKNAMHHVHFQNAWECLLG